MTLRQERVNKFLVQEISDIVRRMKDPRLGFVTFTDVRVSPDLRTAKVGVSILGEPDERKECFKILQGAEGHIRRELMRNTRMKTVPMIQLHLDESAIHSARVLELLRKIEDEQTEG